MITSASASELEWLRLNAWRNPATGQVALHIVNYNVPLGKNNGGQVSPLINLEVNLQLPSGMAVRSIKWGSPENGAKLSVVNQLNSSWSAGGRLTLTLPTMRIYNVVLIS
jgi:hypothetical protein